MMMITANSGKYAHTNTIDALCLPSNNGHVHEMATDTFTRTHTNLFHPLCLYLCLLLLLVLHVRAPRTHTPQCARALSCHFIMTLNHKKPPEISKHRRNFYDAFTFARSLYSLLLLLSFPIPVYLSLSLCVVVIPVSGLGRTNNSNKNS